MVLLTNWGDAWMMTDNGGCGNEHQIHIGFSAPGKVLNAGASASRKCILRLFHVSQQAAVAADDYIAKAANSGYEANFRHKRNKLAAKRHALRKSIFRFFKAYNFIIGAFCRCSPDGIDGNNKKNCCNKQSAPSFQGCHSFLSNKLSGHQREQSHRFRHRKNVINKRGFFAYIPY